MILVAKSCKHSYLPAVYHNVAAAVAAAEVAYFVANVEHIVVAAVGLNVRFRLD